VGLLRRGQERYPDDFFLNHDLGIALLEDGRAGEGVPYLMVAVALRPLTPVAHLHLGMVLEHTGDLDGASRCYRRALDLDPQDAVAHSLLGGALYPKGDLDGAIRCYRKVLDLDPQFPWAHYKLALALQAQGDLDGAIRCYRRTIELNPKEILPHAQLGEALRYRGEYAQAREALCRCMRMLPPGHSLRDWVSRELRRCEVGLARGEKLTAVLQGKARPADAAEALALAYLCPRPSQVYAAARLYSEAFAADPKLADDAEARHRYDAACCAALAASGKGNDADRLDARGRSALRGWARGWLRADLDAMGMRLAGAGSPERGKILDFLRDWRRDPDLAGVREEEALAALPAAERDAWTKLWADVAELTRRAEKPR
jgi:serine/threonine-protein kinase